VRVVDAFIAALDLAELGLDVMRRPPAACYHAATTVEIYLYGYLSQTIASPAMFAD
jgi:hypothetical protein